jgi:hypothetical protein
MSGQNGGNDDWNAFDWANWGQEPGEDGDGQDRGVRGTSGIRGDLARLSRLDDGRSSRTDQLGEEGVADDGPTSGAGEGKWVSQGGILRWEGADDEDEAAGGIRAEAESRWAADDVDLPPGAPDALRIRATRAWLARQRRLEAEAVGFVLAERRELQGSEAQREHAASRGAAPEDSPLDLALVQHTAGMQEYERLLELLDEVASHSGPARALVELHLVLTERLAELASAPEAPSGFATRVLLAEVEGEEAASQDQTVPTPRSTAEWEGRAEAVLAARRRVEWVTAPEPED